MTRGGKAAIAIGAIAGLAGVGGLVAWLLLRKREVAAAVDSGQPVVPWTWWDGILLAWTKDWPLGYMVPMPDPGLGPSVPAIPPSSTTDDPGYAPGVAPSDEGAFNDAQSAWDRAHPEAAAQRRIDEGGDAPAPEEDPGSAGGGIFTGEGFDDE